MGGEIVAEVEGISTVPLLQLPATLASISGLPENTNPHVKK